MEIASMQRERASPKSTLPCWHEVFDAGGQARPGYERPLDFLQKLRAVELRALDERMEATLREMGVNFASQPGEVQRPWTCDLLPHIFSAREWEQIAAGVRQRLCAFEMFLRDVHGGKREILRERFIPIQPVLGSPHYQNVAVGLPRPQDAYLHLCGICLTRDATGALAVKTHHFSRAWGLSYMMQNRRALARVLPEFFEENPVRSLADTPLAIVEGLRGVAAELESEPSVVLLSSGSESAVYSEHSFLARRMGVPLVQGGDLLVLGDRVYLKTVRGLKRVDVIYNRVADAWLDPLVFRKGSSLGIPGLVHCLRRGTVKLINAVGSQLADDTSLLTFAPQIIGYYLGEAPILPTVPTYWLGDLDQREMVLEKPDAFCIRTIFADHLAPECARPASELLRQIAKHPTHFIAQPSRQGARTVHFENGKSVDLEQDHIVFALRDGEGFEVFPGGLTRVFLQGETEWISKDTWVLGDGADHALLQSRPRRFFEANLPSREVTSRVAESFYWLGRYLERAYHQAYLIQVVETLESEELNSAERKLYRPMWNRLLPPLEKSAGESRRSITTRLDRYRLVLAPEAGSVAVTFGRAMQNAERIQECLSPEAWATLSSLRALFSRTKFKEKVEDAECARIARRLSETVTRRIPQFFAVANRTMLGDDGWRFCEAGEMLERAAITANAVLSISKSLTAQPHASEIELSAFLRLLGTRDAYRRIYQMRAEPIAVLEILWQHPQAPRSVLRCLTRCAEVLRESAAPDMPGAAAALNTVDTVIQKIRRADWSEYFHPAPDEDAPASVPPAIAAEQHSPNDLVPLLIELYNATAGIHTAISDGFLSHQAYIAQFVQPFLQGLEHGV